MLNWPLTLVRWFSLTSRVHRKPKCDTHGHLCLIFGNIPILTNLSTLITKINVAKLNSSVKVKVWAFHYDVIVQTRSFVPFNNSISLLQTKTLLKRYKYIVKFILRISDRFYASYINIQPLRDTWPRPLIEKSNFILDDVESIHCDIIKLNITEHCFLLSGFNLSILLVNNILYIFNTPFNLFKSRWLKFCFFFSLSIKAF